MLNLKQVIQTLITFYEDLFLLFLIGLDWQVGSKYNTCSKDRYLDLDRL